MRCHVGIGGRGQVKGEGSDSGERRHDGEGAGFGEAGVLVG